MKSTKDKTVAVNSYNKYGNRTFVKWYKEYKNEKNVY